MNATRTFIAILALLCLVTACSQSTPRPEDSEQLYQSGYTLMIERQYEKACIAFRKALRANEKNAQAWNDMSYCLMELGKYTDAAKAAQKAADYYEYATLYEDKLSFRNDALVQVGEAYLLQQKLTEARNQFQAVYDLAPENYNTILAIVVTYIRCGHADTAAAFCEANTLNQAEHPAALAALYVMLAQCQDGLENTDAALSAIQKARIYCEKAGITEHDSTINTLAARLGAAASVSLPSNPTTGFSWECSIAEPLVATLATTTYTQDEAPEGMAGVGGVEVFTFACKAVGSTGLTFTYRRPWEGGETAEVRHAELTVDERLHGTITFLD